MSTQTVTDPDLSSFLDYLRAECGLAENTLVAYRHDLELLLASLGGQALAAATRDDLLSFLAGEAKRTSGATVSRRIAAIRMFYRFLRSENPRAADPSGILERPETWERLPRVLSPADVAAMLAAPAAEMKALLGRRRAAFHRALYLRDTALLETLYATGCRASEVADLELAAVNLDIGYLRCRGKGSKERIVPVGEAARAAISSYLGLGRPALLHGKESPFLFLSRSGARLDRTNVWRLVKYYLAAAGVRKPASTHTLRHSFATHMLQGGAGLRVIQEMLGHSSPTTTQIYTHLDRRALVEAHRKFHPRG
ncbi:MAG TPA: tyrosine recombinase [Planctomycetota bacterium]|nr:tyrosine recombinase [Planctomycetota bacterium]